MDVGGDGPEDKFAPEFLIKALETQLEGMKDLVESERLAQTPKAPAPRLMTVESNPRAGEAARPRRIAIPGASRPKRGFLRRMFG
ncbi:hypothetical protein [Rhizobium leguminosarum]